MHVNKARIQDTCKRRMLCGNVSIQSDSLECLREKGAIAALLDFRMRSDVVDI